MTSCNAKVQPEQSVSPLSLSHKGHSLLQCWEEGHALLAAITVL